MLNMWMEKLEQTMKDAQRTEAGQKKAGGHTNETRFEATISDPEQQR
jgi:hypothetical protein